MVSRLGALIGQGPIGPSEYQIAIRDASGFLQSPAESGSPSAREFRLFLRRFAVDSEAGADTIYTGSIGTGIFASERQFPFVFQGRFLCPMDGNGAVTMGTSFVAYIDESGDEGFRFRRNADEQASSDWFVLAGMVTRRQTDPETVKAVDAVRCDLKVRPRDAIHWKKLKHAEKVRYTQIMAPLPARVAAVCVHKPSLSEPEKFREQYRLYFYAVRCLLERLSWLVRDLADGVRRNGDGAVGLVFSNRQGMPYERMQAYLHLLRRQQHAGHDIRIEFDRVQVAGLKTQTPGTSLGLQLADAAAGAFFNALERDRFGNTEPRYLQILSPLLYRYEQNVHGYGFKILPTRAAVEDGPQQCLSWLPQFE